MIVRTYLLILPGPRPGHESESCLSFFFSRFFFGGVRNKKGARFPDGSISRATRGLIVHVSLWLAERGTVLYVTDEPMKDFDPHSLNLTTSLGF